NETDSARRTIFIIVGVVSLLLIGGLIYLITRPTPAGSGTGEARLQGAGVMHEGTPEFQQAMQNIRMDDAEATEARRALGDIVMDLRTTVRNFSGRTVTGLEIYAAVLDMQKKPVKARTIIWIPGRAPELENNKTTEVHVGMEGFRESDDRASLQMKITAIRLQ
ncbi:MAG TPA: hypothetical protein VK619_02660, partial [Pyrinomonadaceae bacterium]|nr:hypothetical protein [Pyrinomonadaceae bacterium]